MQILLKLKIIDFTNLENFLIEFKTNSDKHIKIEQLRENFLKLP